MGRGGQQIQDPDGTCKAKYTWDDVKKHVHRKDQWIVVDNEVYDISTWSRRHPGGSKIISHYAGQDATVSMGLNHTQSIFMYTHTHTHTQMADVFGVITNKQTVKLFLGGGPYLFQVWNAS